MINIFKKFKDGLKKTTSNFSKGIKENELLLGTWQGIYLFEHRLDPAKRIVVHHFVGN